METARLLRTAARPAGTPALHELNPKLQVRGLNFFYGGNRALKDINVPLYLLAGERDDITTREQVFAAAHLVGTPHSAIVMAMTPGGHIGLFMGSKTLAEAWPAIGHWMKSHEHG